MLGENSFWHDVTVNAYQSRRFAETGDLDTVWASIRDSRDKVSRHGTCGLWVCVWAGAGECTGQWAEMKSGHGVGQHTRLARKGGQAWSEG
jgi:hypothetical protein